MGPSLLPPFSTWKDYHGKVKVRPVMPGVVEKIVPRVQQVFQRIECNSIADADDARFNYFVEKVFHLSEKVSSSSNFGG